MPRPSHWNPNSDPNAPHVPQPMGGEPGSTPSAVAGVVAREIAQLRLAMEYALDVSRDEQQALEALLRACARPRFASGACYPFVQDGLQFFAPGVDLAREAARCYRHIRYGVTVLVDDDDRMQVTGWAWDLLSGNYAETPESFMKQASEVIEGRVYLRSVAGNESALRALVNRRGAHAERNAILKVLPRWLVEEAVDAAVATNVRQAEVELEATRKVLAASFKSRGVSRAQLEGHLGHSLDEVTPEEIASLRGIFASLRDGATEIGDHFEVEEPKPKKAAPRKKAAKKRTRKKAKKKAAKRKPKEPDVEPKGGGKAEIVESVPEDAHEVSALEALLGGQAPELPGSALEETEPAPIDPMALAGGALG